MTESEDQIQNSPQEQAGPKFTTLPRRGWREYILEGLMIFVAVMLGFFAEQLREDLSERSQEKELAFSLYNDLKIDTAEIINTYRNKIWVKNIYDSAIKILSSRVEPMDAGFLYYASQYLTVNDIFTPQDVTYQELKGSGTFQYLLNVKLRKNIAQYYSLHLFYQSLDGPFFNHQFRDSFTMEETKLFDVRELHNLTRIGQVGFRQLFRIPNHPLKLKVVDHEALDNLYLRFSNASFKTNGSIILLQGLLEIADNNLTQLRESYQF